MRLKNGDLVSSSEIHRANKRVVTLLGNNSGRNLGDAAILSSLLNCFKEHSPNTTVFNPTMNPNWFKRHYGKKFTNCVPVDVRPQTLSLRLFGLPTIRCLQKSDLAIICDGIIFGYKLFSPHNFLISLYGLLPFIPKKCSLVVFCGGIGPFPSALSRYLAKKVLNRCNLIIMRDIDSVNLAKHIGVTRKIELVGDSAYLNEIAPEHVTGKILSEIGIPVGDYKYFGFNVTPYIDNWLSKENKLGNADKFLQKLAEQVSAANKIIGSNVVPLVFSCSPMDESYSNEFANLIGGKVINNSTYLSHEIQAVMAKCEIVFGMRFHSLVLSSSAGVPVVGMIYAPKVEGLMGFLETPNCGIALTEVEEGKLKEHIVKCFEERESIRKVQQRKILELRGIARQKFVDMCQTYLA